MKIGPNPSEVTNLSANRSAQPVSAPAPAPKADATAQTQTQAASSGGAAAVGVPVSVSRLAKTLSAAGQTSGADPKFNAGKVQSVRDALANGTYKADSQAIADGLLADAEDFLRLQSK
jgi:negative regulator of flagellin synthesis FlgM